MSTSTRPPKAMFSVFSDENASNTGLQSRSSSSTHASKSSSTASINSSKRIKMAPLAATASNSTTKTSTGLYGPTIAQQPRKALAPKAVITVYTDDKENQDPLGGRRKALSAKGKGKESSSECGNKHRATIERNLWNGKKPFDDASPEKEIPLRKKGNSSSKFIYDMPGVEARSHVTSGTRSSSSSKTSKEAFRAPASRIPSAPGMAISRPNKKSKAIPAPLKPSPTKLPKFEIFQDHHPASSTFGSPQAGSSSPCVAVVTSQHETFKSPIVSQALVDARARELTESPLADVTLAYTGRGRFTNNIATSPTADSGFGSRETSVSPLPSARSFSSSNRSRLSSSLILSTGQHNDEHEAYGAGEDELHEADLPKELERLSLSLPTAQAPNQKRRISQVSSTLSRSAKSSTASSSMSSNIDEVPDTRLSDFEGNLHNDHRHEQELGDNVPKNLPKREMDAENVIFKAPRTLPSRILPFGSSMSASKQRPRDVPGKCPR